MRVMTTFISDLKPKNIKILLCGIPIVLLEYIILKY